MVDNTIWLLITTAVVVVAGGVSGWASATLRRREAKAERIRQEVILWTNPVLGAVKSLVGPLTFTTELSPEPSKGFASA